jgi:hypothetical protein
MSKDTTRPAGPTINAERSNYLARRTISYLLGHPSAAERAHVEDPVRAKGRAGHAIVLLVFGRVHVAPPLAVAAIQQYDVDVVANDQFMQARI